MDLRYNHGVVVSNALLDFFKKELSDIFVYSDNSIDFGSDLPYQVISSTTNGDGKMTLIVENDIRHDIYKIPDLSVFTGVINSYSRVNIDSISKIDELSFSVNISGVNQSFYGQTLVSNEISVFGLRLQNSIFYECDFFNFGASYSRSRISNKTFGITARLLITTKDDQTNLSIEYITQKINDLIFYDNMGKVPIEIDKNIFYIFPFGSLNHMNISQENKEINSRMVTISFSYMLRYK
ncbi:MAG: hypothetical protein ACRCZ9_05690 [Fusobacteriaceae bacterium]